MVRNIDLPECLVFYGMPDTLFGSPEDAPDSGLLSLLQECQDTDTAVVILPDATDPTTETTATPPSFSHLPVSNIHYHVPLARPPNPLDLYQALNAITVQPRPFGGSSGFGVKQYADPERTPLAARTVVFCQTLDQTRAARYCGMRVLCFRDNDLADAILDDPHSIDVYLDDIATPGSFWLNPPNPQDEEGNKVDIHELIEYYSNQQSPDSDSATEPQPSIETASEAQEEMGDDEMQRILADLSPL